MFYSRLIVRVSVILRGTGIEIKNSDPSNDVDTEGKNGRLC